MLFIINWGMNWWLLWGTAVVLRLPQRKWAMMLSAAVGSLAAFLWLLSPVSLGKEILLKLTVALGMIQLCYLPERLGALLKATGVFILLSALLAGTTYALALSGTSITGESTPRIMWYLLLGGPLILTIPLKSLWAGLSRYYHATTHSAPLRFRLGNYVVEQDAVLDTGNTLHEPLSYKPVVVVDFAAIREQLPQDLSSVVATWGQTSCCSLDMLPDILMERISLIPFYTVSGQSLMLGVRPDSCEIWTKGTWHRFDAVIGFAPGEAKLHGKTALLPYTVWPA